MGESDVDEQRTTMTSDDQRPVAQADLPQTPAQTANGAPGQQATSAKRRVWRRLQRLLRDDPEFNPTKKPSGNPTDNDAPHGS